jgi:hypothetical protein
MAAERKRSRKRSGKLWRWVRYLVIVLTGGGLGVGGWHVSENTFLGRLLGFARQEIARGDAPEAVKDGLGKVLAATGSFKESGTYEVRFAQVSLDDGLFPRGQAINILVRVLKLGDDDKETLVWTSRSYGDRIAVPGKDELTFRWPDQPFEVDWRPGDRFVVEVWNHKTLRSRKVLEYDAGTDDEFPLRTGKHVIARLADGKIADNPGANCIAFESKPVRAAQPGPDANDRLAGRPLTIR